MEAGRKRRRRRHGRRREAAEGPAPVGAEFGQLAEGVPADYLALTVERGTPLPYRGREPEQEEEEEAVEEVGPAKRRRVNSGKLFWFIRSKSYVPIQEIRRRFEIPPTDMSVIQDDGDRLYVGLPQDVADVVANLRRQQKIGLECSPDFKTRVVVGVYPLRRI